ncbi:hypothetical protein CPC08DRAFT_712830 [Agrocybe pediades]|nr:hypothetical protein CPC08DRAFT_712830 [Agrocybe pediades]
MALLEATPKGKYVNSQWQDFKPDLRCRIRLPENPVFGTRWQVFEASLWNDIVDHMEFLLVDATTRMCTVTSDINTTDKKMYETFFSLEQS